MMGISRANPGRHVGVRTRRGPSVGLRAIYAIKSKVMVGPEGKQPSLRNRNNIKDLNVRVGVNVGTHSPLQSQRLIRRERVRLKRLC